MKTFLQLLLLLFISSISCQNITKDFSFTYLYPTTIGDSNVPINLLVDTTEYDSILFSNSDRVYSEKIQNETDLDLFKDNIRISGITLQNFTFSVKEDYTNLNNSALQGIFGLGISSRTKKNEIISSLQKQKLIGKEIVFVNTKPESKISFLTETNIELLNEYKQNCSLLNASLINDTKYRDSWICDFSHIASSNMKDENDLLSFNNTIPLNGRALFDSTTMYIIIPQEYLELVIELIGINLKECSTKNDDSNTFNEIIIDCNFEEGNNRLHQLHGLYFMIEGFAYGIKVEDLFFHLEENQYSLKIKFRKELNNIWILGYPFFANYDLAFDFDNQAVKFKGNDIFNFTNEYHTWKEENEKFLNREYNDKMKIIIGGIISCVIILIVLVMIIRAFTRRNNPKVHSELIEEIPNNINQ